MRCKDTEKYTHTQISTHFLFSREALKTTVRHFRTTVGDTLVLLSIVGFDGFRLDDDGCIATGERTAFGSDGTRDVAGRQSQCHRDRCGNSQCEVFDCLDEALFLSFC